jgi:hypothetical protein
MCSAPIPDSRINAAVPAQEDSFLLMQTTCAPAVASLSAVPLPIPRPAPVTTQILPDKFDSFIICFRGKTWKKFVNAETKKTLPKVDCFFLIASQDES